MFPVASTTGLLIWGLVFAIVGGAILGLEGYHGRSRSNLTYLMMALGSLLFVGGVILVVNFICWQPERMGAVQQAYTARSNADVATFVTFLTVLAVIQLLLAAVGLCYACFQVGELVYARRNGESTRKASVHLAFAGIPVAVAVFFGINAYIVASLALLVLHP